MTENLLSSPQQIIDCLKVSYGIEISLLTPLLKGADMDAAIYKAEALNHSPYFVKVKLRSAPSVPSIVMDFLGKADVQHIIPVIKTLAGGEVETIGNYTVIVSPYINGKDGFRRELTKNQWIAFGRAMRRIHGINVPSSVQAKVRREIFSPQWRQAVRTLISLIESDSTDSNEFLSLFMKHLTTIRQLVERAEQLAQVAQKESVPFVLCHSDIHAGNVLIDKRGHFYIIDWDDPIMAPQERDLMFIGAGVGNVWNMPYEEELFYQGYGATEVNQTLLAYYRHERILEDIAEYGHKLLLSSEGGEDRRRWYGELKDQFKPHGVIDIAFKSDITSLVMKV